MNSRSVLGAGRGYITLIALIGVMALGSVYYGTLLNARWVESSRESHSKTEKVLLADYHSDPLMQRDGRYFYRSEENIMWWLFMSRNISPLKEMLRFKMSVREFHKYTKDYISQNTAAHTVGAGREIRETGKYRKYMNEFRDEKSGVVFVIPSFREMPDSARKSQEYSEDMAAAFMLRTKDNLKYYAGNILTDSQEIASYYSTPFKNPLFKKNTGLDMPFSQY